MTTIESNKLIAEFMGYDTEVLNILAGEWEVAEFNFHRSWDALIPVVGKINSFAYYRNPEIIISKRGVELFCEGLYDRRNSLTIDAAYTACAKFIKSHNKKQAC